MVIQLCLVRDAALLMKVRLLPIVAIALHCCAVDVSWRIVSCAALTGTAFVQSTMLHARLSAPCRAPRCALAMASSWNLCVVPATFSSAPTASARSTRHTICAASTTSARQRWLRCRSSCLVQISASPTSALQQMQSCSFPGSCVAATKQLARQSRKRTTSSVRLSRTASSR